MAVVYQLDEMLMDSGLRDEWLAAMRAGAVCIYPTDTVYGIGMVYDPDDAASRSIKIINTVRSSPVDKKVSCLVPSFDWLYDRYVATDLFVQGDLEQYAAQYGSITLIMDDISPGWRVIDHPMQQLVAMIGVPIISSSANRSGREPATSVDTIDIDLLDDVDIVIDGGLCDSSPSTLIDVQRACVIPRKPLI